MKKALAFFLIFTTLCTLVPFAPAEEAEPETIAVGDWTCTVQEDGTAVITKYSGKEAKLSIPETIDGKAVTGIGDGAFFYCKSIVSVTIPDSVTSIGDNPFKQCVRLSEISVSPDHPYLETIGGVLFSKPDRKLVCYPAADLSEAYEIPRGTITIGNNAFCFCESLKSVTIPDSVTNIGKYAFNYCMSLASVTIPDSVAVIGDWAFSGCKSLVSVTIPGSVTGIGNWAFSFCESLASVTIPESVTKIGKDAFTNCDSLIMAVSRDSYAKQYCEEHRIKYQYPDAGN